MYSPGLWKHVCSVERRQLQRLACPRWTGLIPSLLQNGLGQILWRRIKKLLILSKFNEFSKSRCKSCVEEYTHKNVITLGNFFGRYKCHSGKWNFYKNIYFQLNKNLFTIVLTKLYLFYRKINLFFLFIWFIYFMAVIFFHLHEVWTKYDKI